MPTCSEYGKQGVVNGVWLAAKLISSYRPGCVHGYDREIR
ncbi:MAG: membrane protein insertion efficiency factor YidD [Gammaproteobacteria bacterium]